VPDIVALAKGMSSGYAPLAGIVAAEQVAGEFWGEGRAFRHGHTFGGNPVSATAGVANITQILEGGLIGHARRVGAYLQQQGRTLREQSIVGDVRGVGLLLGAELVADRKSRAQLPAQVAPGLRVQAAAKQRGLLLRASPNWIALAPPLITGESEIDEMLSIVQASIEEVQARVSP
jgi:putrescine aminotransferase